MRKYKIIFALVFIIFSFGAGVIWNYTNNLKKVANNFFLSLKNKNVEQASTFLTKEFLNNSDNKELTEFMLRDYISNFKKLSWNMSTFALGGGGSLSGFINGTDGQQIPIELSFLKEANDWKIYSIKQKQFGFLTTDKLILSDLEKIKLLNKTTNEIILARDSEENLAKFYKNLSSFLRKEISLRQMKDRFHGILKAINIDGIYIDPTILSNKSNIDTDGTFDITGYYDIKDQRIHFSYSYIHQGLDWKLIKLSLKVL